MKTVKYLLDRLTGINQDAPVKVIQEVSCLHCGKEGQYENYLTDIAFLKTRENKEIVAETYLWGQELWVPESEK